MPLRLSTSDRKLFIGMALVLCLLILGGIVFANKAGSKAEIPTTYSAGSEGAKAAYLLLQDLGHPVSRWQKPLAELPEPAGKTLIVADPEEAPTQQDKKQLENFVSGGGRVIVTGMFAALYLTKGSAVPDFVEGMLWKKERALSPSAITRQAPEITLAPQAHWSDGNIATPLYGDDDKIRVVKYIYGKGEVMWWASATPLTNAGLREPGNLEFLLASIGDGQGEILWDEYIHGHRDTLGASIARSPVIWLALQSALLGAAILFTFSRRSGPVFPPIHDVRLSPLEFVQTLGGLYEHAGAGSVAVDIFYQRFRYWLTRRLGMAGNASADDLQRAVTQRGLLKDEQFAGTLRECETARYDTNLAPARALSLIRALHDFAAQMKLFPMLTGVKEKD